MTQKPTNLTATQQKVADHLAKGGKVIRDKNADEGKGFKAAGISMIMPGTAQKLMDLGLMVLTDETEVSEIYTQPGNIEATEEEEESTEGLTEAERRRRQVEKKVESDRKAWATNSVTPKKEQKREAAPRAEESVEPIDALMWVGTNSYPTIEDFISEARSHGVSKRMSKLPRNIVPGSSRIFFVHDEGVEGEATIFGYSLVGRLEVIANEESQVPVHLRERVQQVTLDQVAEEPDRGCGRREEIGAMYATAYQEDVQSLLTDLPEGQTLVGGSLVVFDAPVLYSAVFDTYPKRFRSYKRVDGEAILDAPEEARAAEYPQQRIINEIHVDLPAEMLDRDPGARWTDEEREALIEMVDRYGNHSRAFRDFALVTGRSREGVAYQWYRNIKNQREK